MSRGIKILEDESRFERCGVAHISFHTAKKCGCIAAGTQDVDPEENRSYWSRIEARNRQKSNR